MRDRRAKSHKRAMPEVAGKSRGGEAGQSLLEFLLLLMLGVVEIGRAAYISITVSHAAAAGVQYGAQSSKATDITGMETAATNDVGSDAIGGTMSANAYYGCVCDQGPSGQTPGSCENATINCTSGSTSCSCTNLGASCTSPNQIVTCVKVTTLDNFSPLFHYPGLPSSFTASGNAVMRERQ